MIPYMFLSSIFLKNILGNVTNVTKNIAFLTHPHIDARIYPVDPHGFASGLRGSSGVKCSATKLRSFRLSPRGLCSPRLVPDFRLARWVTWKVAKKCEEQEETYHVVI